MNNQTIGQACSLNWRQLCLEIYRTLDRPDPQRFAELRLQGSSMLKDSMPDEFNRRIFNLELHLIDLQAALYLCSPLEAVSAWQQLELFHSRHADVAALAAPLARARYIAAVSLLQAGFGRELPIELDQLRSALDLERGTDAQLTQAMLQDALMNDDHKLAIQACCLASSFGDLPSDRFELHFRQLSLTLLEGRARARQLADLLRSCDSYGHWQILIGPVWQASLHAEIIPLKNWKLHLEAHERCHDWIYQEIAKQTG